MPGLGALVEVRYPLGARVFTGRPLAEHEEGEWQELEEARSAAV
jgi:hypothetical protein